MLLHQTPLSFFNQNIIRKKAFIIFFKKITAIQKIMNFRFENVQLKSKNFI